MDAPWVALRWFGHGSDHRCGPAGLCHHRGGLVVHPLLTWGMLLLVPLDEPWAKSLPVLTALPTGSLVFVLSSQYGVYTRRSTSVILASTQVSVVTLSLLFNLLGLR
jgi:predicted permease